MSIQNGERLATKQDLADMYQAILPYLGGMPEVLANKFSKGDMYSTDEKMIGQWIDGKPLYQKVIPYDSTITISSTRAEPYIADITDLDIETSVYCQATFKWGATNFKTTPFIHEVGGGNIVVTVDTVSDGNTFQVQLIGKRPSGSTDITNLKTIIQYTKKTDSPVAVGSDTDYSTSEKIIGTWIDSKTLYQITVSITFGTVTDGVAAYASSDIPSNIEEAFLDSACVHPTDNVINAVNDAWVSTQTYFTRIYIDKGTNKIFASTNRSQFSNKTVYATIKYTKTS